jgi:putative MATE family efflux protein
MQNDRVRALASEGIGRLLWKLSLPAGIGMFVMALYNVVDTIFLGHAVGPLAIAGLSIVFPVQMVVLGMGQMIGIGGASLLSRSLGARDVGRAERTLGNAVLLACLLGIVIPVVGLSGGSFWLRLFGASDAVLPYAKDYFDIILLGTMFQVFAMSANGLVRAEGNARVPMVAMIVGAVLNIALDAGFILGLRMGVAGAATATVLSQVVSATYLVSYYLLRRSSVRIAMRNLVPERSVMREILAIGVSSFVRTTAASLVIVFVNRSLVAYGGDIALAAYGVLHRILMFLFMPIISIGQGLQPVLGFSYGSKRYDRALRAIQVSTIVATALSVTSFLILFFLPSPIIRIFTTDSALISAGSSGARLMFLAMYLVGFQMVGSVVFQAIGKAVPAFVTAISRNILFFLPAIFILPRFLGLDGVWASFPVADSLSFVLTLLLVLPQIRRFRRAALESRAVVGALASDNPGTTASGSDSIGANGENRGH